MTHPATQPALAHPLHARLLAHVGLHLHDPALGVTSLQTCFGLSRATVYRIFQQVGGLQSYIRDRRLDAAHGHLASVPDCSLTWLLYELGFNSERQFQRAFQARFGMAPSDWKRQCLQRALAPRRRTVRRGWQGFPVGPVFDGVPSMGSFNGVRVI